MDSCFCYWSYCRVSLASKSSHKTFGLVIGVAVHLFNKMLKEIFMKVVVFKGTKWLNFLLRKIFRIKKEKTN